MLKISDLSFIQDCNEVFSMFQSEYKLKPFHGAKVCFVGFPEEEEKHMTEVLLSNGGAVANLEDPTCTHVVIIINCFDLNKIGFDLTFFFTVTNLLHLEFGFPIDFKLFRFKLLNRSIDNVPLFIRRSVFTIDDVTLSQHQPEIAWSLGFLGNGRFRSLHFGTCTAFTQNHISRFM